MVGFMVYENYKQMIAKELLTLGKQKVEQKRKKIIVYHMARLQISFSDHGNLNSKY